MTASEAPTPIPASPSRYRMAGLVIVVLALVLAGWGVVSRLSAHAALRAKAADNAVPTVAIAYPQAGPPAEEVILPGEVKGLLETPIYARTSGYVKAWRVDIGAHVKAGEVLAIIEAPEVDEQLRQAQADLKTAQANAIVAKSTSDRVQALVSTQSVSRQEGEDRAAQAAATAATVDGARANVARLKQLQGFERVVAPYDGVITARETDVGNLIDAGSGVGPELFRIADVRQLRTYVDVPQSYASEIKDGVEADLAFPDQPGKVFPAKVVRTASALAPQTRTLKVELDLPNANGGLFPGAFTQAHFKIPNAGRALRISGNALLFRADGLRVAVVGADDRIALRPVTIGRDFGSSVEILVGLGPSDRVVLNPVASISAGDKVRVAQPAAPKAGGAA